MAADEPYDDRAAWEHYADPANREAAQGPGVRPRKRPSLSAQVPIRFTPETIEAVGRVAAYDGMSVSSWIRRAVELELRRRGVADDVPGDRASALEALASARQALLDLERALATAAPGLQPKTR